MVLLDIDTATAYQIQVITIKYWEWAILPNLFMFLLIFTSRKKLVKIATEPEYRYYLLGFYAKFFGSVLFVLVYMYYYKGGDTLRYFESAMSMANLFYKNPGDYFYVLFSPPNPEARSAFDYFTGFPYEYIYYDPKTFMVVRIISPLVIITGKSYLITSVLIGFFTFKGIWKMFQLFHKYYPQLHTQLAIGILFFPSAIFWGSGVLKDSLTLMGTCLFVYHSHQVFIIKKGKTINYIMIAVSAFIMISIKPYIFMILFPGTLFWIFYERINRIKSTFLIVLLVPVIIIGTILFSVVFFQTMGDSLDKFSVDKAMNTAAVTQNDLKQDYYEGKSFDIGNFDGTPQSALKLMPMAIMAGMIRPFLYEADSPFMLLSALENLIILWLILVVLFKGGVKRTAKVIIKNPIVMYCFLFSILFAFMLGITTSNFGALIRFKIPLLPFLVSGLFITLYHLKRGDFKRV